MKKKKCSRISWSGTLVALILVGLFFGVTAFAETDRSVAVSAVGTSNGVEFRVQDQGIETFQVNIFTPNGKSLFNSGSVNSNSLTWNVTDSSGSRVPFGVYLYQFVGKSSAGEVATKGVAKIFVGPNQVAAEPVRSKKLSPMKNGNGKGSCNCTTIQDGELTYNEGRYLEGETLEPGYDPYGYNYQAHIFKGSYANYYLNVLGLPPYGGNDDAYYQRLVEEDFAEDVEGAKALMSGIEWLWSSRNTHLVMKWSDTWLSNKDCNDDGKLDRGYSCYTEKADSSACEGAWVTNHMKGGQGKDKWTYFSKIVAPSYDEAYKEDDVWYTDDGEEIGPVIWGAYAKVQVVESGEGATYISPAGPGLGKWKDKE